jgi:hypothetical protein
MHRDTDFIAKGKDGQPALLISMSFSTSDVRPPPITLEHLVVDHGVECRIRRSDGYIHQGIFTVVRCINSDELLKKYFLQAIVPIVQALPPVPAYGDIILAVNSLAELFRQLNMPSQKSLLGLWAELFLIASTNDPQVLIEAWRSTPGDIYDFNLGIERIEVKGSSSRRRLHFFSFEQLHPPSQAIVIIASMFVEEAGSGNSIFDLVDIIRGKLGGSFDLAQRIDQVVSATLGSSWRQAMGMRFDYEMACSSIAYYQCSSIPSVPGPLPPGVSHVRFQADLSLSRRVDLGTMSGVGNLFKALTKS